MTKNDLHNIIDIINDCIKKEKQYAYNYIKLNPTDSKSRNRDREMITSGMLTVWLAIKEKYERVWESES